MLRAAAAERNCQPIADVLGRYLRDSMKVLEIASGTGQHVVHFGSLFPNVIWQPSEVDARSLHSVVAHIDNSNLQNLRVPLFIDVVNPVEKWALPADFSPQAVDVILNANMIHISSNAAVEGLFRAAGCLLKGEHGMLITYGPYAIDGKIFPQSNVDFDSSLRSQNPEWGLRDIRSLKELATKYGLRFIARHEMPANNNILVFGKT